MIHKNEKERTILNERYSRQILFPPVGEKGQSALAESHVLIVEPVHLEQHLLKGLSDLELVL